MVSHSTPKCFSIKRSSWSTQWPSSAQYHCVSQLVWGICTNMLYYIQCFSIFFFYILHQRLVLIKTPTSYYHPYYTKVHFLWSNENFTLEIYNYRTVSTRTFQNIFCNVTCFSGSLCQIVCVYRRNSYETCENVLRMYVYFCILA